ncbi:MAG: hypothetical protein V3S69_07610 [Dehalococcoidales bacterium]
MPTTVLRLSGTTFLILEPGDNLSMPLMFVLLRSRLIASLCSGSLLTGMDFLETRLLFPTIPVIPVPSLPLRAGLPVIVGTEVFLSLIELPIRVLSFELIRLPKLPAGDLCVLGTVGFLVLIILPIREDLPELIRLLELLTCGRVLRTLGFLVLIILPIRELLLELIRLAELPACGFAVLRTLGVLVLIEPPIRELLPELIRLLKLPACGCVLRTLGVLVLIEPPIRELLLELIRLPELTAVCLPVPELIVVGFLLPIEMLEGLRVLDVIPGRLVTGRLTVTLLG